MAVYQHNESQPLKPSKHRVGICPQRAPFMCEPNESCPCRNSHKRHFARALSR